MSRIIMTLLVAATIATQVAIAADTKPAPDAPTAAGADKKAEAAQGITGTVVQMSGDFMPSVGPKPAGRNATKPLSVPVHVFKGKVEVFQKPDVKHPAFLQKVQSGKDGVFRCALPSGEYTVVAEINGMLYLNSFTDGPKGAMYWSTVTVEKGKWTQFDIRDSSNATF